MNFIHISSLILSLAVFNSCNDSKIIICKPEPSHHSAQTKTDTAGRSFSDKETFYVSTFAGDGTIGSIDGPRLYSRFNNPNGIAIDKDGNIFIADGVNHKIRKINSLGQVTTIAGNGTVGAADGPGPNASFWQPIAVAVDNEGNVFVTDMNNKIRKIDSEGMVSTFAGSGTYGWQDGTGQKAHFKYPQNMAIDNEGNIYTADAQNHIIRKITKDGYVCTYAGTGSPGSEDGPADKASFLEPVGIAIAPQGKLFVSDGNHKIREINADGVVSTYAGNGEAGSDDGPANKASFNYPAGLTVDKYGNLYVADLLNYKIRKISTSGYVSTIAGNENSGALEGEGLNASFSAPTSIIIDDNRVIYVTDAFNQKIRVLSRKPQNKGRTFMGQIIKHRKHLSFVELKSVQLSSSVLYSLYNPETSH